MVEIDPKLKSLSKTTFFCALLVHNSLQVWHNN